jgi:hypothetical protein
MAVPQRTGKDRISGTLATQEKEELQMEIERQQSWAQKAC